LLPIGHRQLRRHRLCPDPLHGGVQFRLQRIAMVACGTSHFWAREIAALGHEVKLMPPAS